MTKRTLRVSWVVLSTALMAVGTASVARADQLLVARVPFDFMVGDARLPAGNYIVKETFGNPSVVLIESADGRNSVYTLTFAAALDQSDARPELVFEKVDNQYFLKRIDTLDGAERETVRTRAMREHERS
jgi:hypothetical protein